MEKSPNLGIFKDFDEVAKETLCYLQEKYGFGLWMVTRTVSDDWIVLKSKDSAYNVSDGDILKWSDTFCYQMVQHNAPNIAPDSKKIEAYANAQIRKELAIEAYIGYPILKSDGSLFGTLCAIDPLPQSDDLLKEDPLFKLLSQYLSLLINNELNALSLQNQIKELKDKTFRDPLTNLLNRQTWETLIERQEKKCKIFEEPTLVILLDLDELKKVNDAYGYEEGDQYIKNAAKALFDATRKNEAIARLGDDEFGLLIEGDIALNPTTLLDRIQKYLDTIGVSASIGWAKRNPNGTLKDAIKKANKEMYLNKSTKKAN